MNGKVMIKWIGFALAASLLSACFGPPKRAVDIAHHALMVSPKDVSAYPVIGAPTIRKVEVRAASWLATTDMQYRFSYSEPTRRRIYADSRWVAVPAEMIEVAMSREIAKAAGDPSAGCRLRVELDEFIQEFDSAQSSRAIIDARFSLLSSRSDVSLAQYRVQQSRKTDSGNAAGGVLALSTLTAALTEEAEQWLLRLKRDSPAVVSNCR
jgi:cholesterol transport system auxiliary component